MLGLIGTCLKAWQLMVGWKGWALRRLAVSAKGATLAAGTLQGGATARHSARTGRLDTGTRAGSPVALTLRPAIRASGATDMCGASRGCTCGDAALAGALPLQAPRTLSGHAPRVLRGHAGLGPHIPGGRLTSYACLCSLGAVGRWEGLLGPAWRPTGRTLGP